MTGRLLLLTATFLLTALLTTRASEPEALPVRQPLADMPLAVGGWIGREAPALTPEVESVLGADDYVNRVYLSTTEPPVGVFVGYYESQQQGDTMHSPLNCLPGAGWLPVKRDRTSIAVDGRDAPIIVNRFLIEKGLDRQVVLYWYQSQGRVTASEYSSKALLIYDALRSHRSDAALVRIVSPVLPGDANEVLAEARTIRFVQALFPHLGKYLPS